ATSRASMPAFAMSCSTARSSTLCARPRSSSRAGGATTHASIGYKLPAPEVFVPAFARGRLRYADQLRRHADKPPTLNYNPTWTVSGALTSPINERLSFTGKPRRLTVSPARRPRDRLSERQTNPRGPARIAANIIVETAHIA